MENKKIIASFELTIMIVYLFAFSYGISMTDGTFQQLKNKYTKIEAQSKINPKTPMTVSIFSFILNQIKKPMVPVVSAMDAGCCSVAHTGEKCATTTRDLCSGEFSSGTLCKDTSFCQKGCCFDANTGVYDKNVLKSDCQTNWKADPNCNMPQAKLGCCVVGDTSFFDTEGQCKTRTQTFAQGNSPIVTWTTDSSEVQCLILSKNQNTGACVLPDKDCQSTTETECNGLDGQFNEGYLCTAPSLNTTCKMTKQTTCVDGKDGAYFLDSCGNIANIYNSKKAKDQSYWEKIILPENSCGADSSDANANSTSCGNCNRFRGSICRSAIKNNFKVNMGDSYCKDTSCTFNGVKYKNGESWCVYDGQIGNGNDVVGSRHWKYVCTQGRVQVEPCADYRNQICIQSDTKSKNGESVVFRNAACVANNWRQCIELNTEKNGTEECKDTLNCRVQAVNVSDYFYFNVCTPEYPEGFSLSNIRYQATAGNICGMATRTCKVVYVAKTWGGCKLVANGDCLTEKFAQNMNEMCRKLGDCGGEVNIVGKYTKNYEVENSPDLNQTWIEGLKKLAIPIPGQFAKVGDYSKFLEMAGAWGKPGDTPNQTMSEFKGNAIAGGVGAIGYAAGVYATGGSLALTELGGMASTEGVASIAGFSVIAIAAAAGFIAGSILAKSMGLSPGGSTLMAIGGALVGTGLAIVWLYSATIPVVGWVIAVIGLIIMFIASLFGGDDCNPVEVKFTCKPWRPPIGGEDCEKCNDNPMKPCSEYRCKSLGAACEIVNKGTKQEMCQSSHDNGIPPTLKPQLEAIMPGQKYSDITDDGFTISPIGGGCLDAYTPLLFGVTTDKLSYCKFDTKMTDFKSMKFDLGGNAYIYNHTATFTLPDPSHGQSQGSNWTGDLTLYIKCMDTFGHITPNFYKVSMCVKQGPDMTPPIIVKLIPENNGIISFDSVEKNITVVTNEPSTCKWDKSDKDYFSMNNSMTCNDKINKPSDAAGYVCTTILPVEASSNTYYIRCLDQPWLKNSTKRNANQESLVYKLRKPDKKIAIDWIKPTKDFETATAMTTINLQVQTSGGGNYHYCSFSFSGYKNMIQMFETGKGKTHSQTLNRPVGTNTIYVKCHDETGDFAEDSTTFKIIRDTSMPQISRILQLNGKLLFYTLKNSECRYSTESCQFNWKGSGLAGNGQIHTINAARGKTYYIRCADALGNAPSGCSISTKML